MTEPKTKYPIESFGPELMKALVRGSREKVILTFDGADGSGKKRAHGFQRRIHTLRQRMRQLNHPDYVLATRAKCSILWGEKAAQYGKKEWEADDQGQRGALIVIQPHDSEFDDVLAEAKYLSADKPLADATAPITEIPRQKDALDDLLTELDK